MWVAKLKWVLGCNDNITELQMKQFTLSEKMFHWHRVDSVETFCKEGWFKYSLLVVRCVF